MLFYNTNQPPVLISQYSLSFIGGWYCCSGTQRVLRRSSVLKVSGIEFPFESAEQNKKAYLYKLHLQPGPVVNCSSDTRGMDGPLKLTVRIDIPLLELGSGRLSSHPALEKVFGAKHERNEQRRMQGGN